MQRQSGELTVNPPGIEMRKIRSILINRLDTDASLNLNQSLAKGFSNETGFDSDFVQEQIMSQF